MFGPAALLPISEDGEVLCKGCRSQTQMIGVVNSFDKEMDKRRTKVVKPS